MKQEQLVHVIKREDVVDIKLEAMNFINDILRTGLTVDDIEVVEDFEEIRITYHFDLFEYHEHVVNPEPQHRRIQQRILCANGVFE